MSTPHPAARSFITIAVLGGGALIALVLLWLTEVISLPVFIGGLVVVTALEALAFLRVIRRMHRTARGTGSITRTSADTDTTGPYRNLGYDPMDGLPGVAGRPGDEDR